MRFGKVEFLSDYVASTLKSLFANVGFKTYEDFLNDLVLAPIELTAVFPSSCEVLENLLCVIFARFPSGREAKRTLRFLETLPKGFLGLSQFCLWH